MTERAIWWRLDELCGPAAAGPSGATVFLLVELADISGIRAALGMAAGDGVIQAFRERMAKLARKRDTYLDMPDDRVGVVLRDIAGPQHIELAAAKLLRLFEAPVTVAGAVIRPEPRAVFVDFAGRRIAGSETLKLAEQGLRRARHDAKSYVIVRADAGSQDPPGRELVQEVEAAFTRGEIELFYQPKVHATHGSIIGAEALLRWLMPGGEVVAPAAFLTAIEHTPLMRVITWRNIKAAVAKCCQWPGDLSVAVNVPASLIRDEEILAVMDDALGFYGLDPKRLMVEVTESAIMHEPERCLAVLERIRTCGVRVSIDDFGTGYSSLAYFRSLPADELKIDRSFIANLCDDRKNEAVVRTIIELAHNFELAVVGEGVEDEHTAHKLRSMGCDALQGYFFGRPQPAAEFARLVEPRPPAHAWSHSV